MQVFKLYWKLTFSKWKTFLIYALIYFSVFAFTILFRNDTATHYQPSTVSIGIIDQDHSELSALLIDYLSETHQVQLYDNSLQMEDALFYQQHVLTLTIPVGFEKAFLEGEGQLTYQSKQGLSASLASSHIQFYLENMYEQYIHHTNISLSELHETLLPILKNEVKVDFGISEIDQSDFFASLNYLSYVMLALLTTMIGSCLIDLKEPQSYARMLASPLSAKQITFELLLGAGSFAFAIQFIFCIIIAFIFPTEFFSIQGGIAFVQLCIYTLSSYTLAIMLGHLVCLSRYPDSVLTMLSQSISLGSAFIGGAFLPQSLISDSISKVASFTPLYWYVKGNSLIQNANSNRLISAWGILMLFTLAFALLTMYLNFSHLSSKQS